MNLFDLINQWGNSYATVKDIPNIIGVTLLIAYAALGIGAWLAFLFTR